GLGLQRHAARREPGHRLARAEAREGPAQRPPTARVVADEERRVGLVVRDVAAAAAGDTHLREGRRAALEDRHPRRRVRLLAGDRGEEAGGASAYDHDAWVSAAYAAIVPAGGRASPVCRGRHVYKPPGVYSAHGN